MQGESECAVAYAGQSLVCKVRREEEKGEQCVSSLS